VVAGQLNQKMCDPGTHRIWFVFLMLAWAFYTVKISATDFAVIYLVLI